MIYLVEYGRKRQKVCCGAHRIHFVAQQLAGFSVKRQRDGSRRRVPNPHTVEPVDRLAVAQRTHRSESNPARRRYPGKVPKGVWFL